MLVVITLANNRRKLVNLLGLIGIGLFVLCGINRNFHACGCIGMNVRVVGKTIDKLAVRPWCSRDYKPTFSGAP